MIERRGRGKRERRAEGEERGRRRGRGGEVGSGRRARRGRRGRRGRIPATDTWHSQKMIDRGRHDEARGRLDIPCQQSPSLSSKDFS